MDRATYLDDLVPLAARLVATVHDEGPEATAAVLNAIATLEHPDDVNPWTALAVTLAAMVDPARTTEETLGWARKLDPGTDALPITDAAARASLFVELALSGKVPARALSNDEGAEVVRQLMERGWPENEIRVHLDDQDGRAVHRWVCRAKSAEQRAKQKQEAAA